MGNVTSIDEKKPSWWSRHSDEIVFGIVCVASIALPIGFGIWANKVMTKEAAIREMKFEKARKAIQEAVERGDTVLPGGEFGVWVIPKNRAS